MTGENPLGADAALRAGGNGASAAALLWWHSVPGLPGERLGVIGGFAADTAGAAADVLRQAGAELRRRGCTLAVGPMDGNTWRRYRFVTGGDAEPPFFLEPVNPPEWPEWWTAAGFAPVAEYHSTVASDLTARDARLDAVAARLRAAGVSWRPLDAGRFEEELGRIHDVSVVSFRDNFLYTPLPREEFVAQYRPLAARLQPELVLIAEQACRPVGFVFALPDFAEAQRGRPVVTVIVKTLAVLPERAHAGLGAVLLGEVHAAARRLGFRRAIHALMHQTNRSRNLSAHYATPFRRYALLARRLAP